ncbi:MAG: D-alanyl-D-alanine carboxypeptidase/D-alanyl-D-alanine-endopeptidase, partial [Gaiellales bacterium]
ARVGPTWEGDLILKGYGDPDLRRLDLKRLARKLRATGLRRVTGSVVGDESHFDGVRTAPGWKPSFYKRWSPPISALVVNRARFAGTVSDEPARAAALIFTRLLERQGIDVAGEPRVGSPDVANATRLARDLSRPLAALVDRMNTESDNFIAEMLIKTLGAQAHQTGTTAAGARVVKETLRTLGIPVARVRIRDGSGLSRSDRLTPRALSAMLLAALGDAGIGEVFVGSLPVGGMTGTLEERLRKRPALGRIRAKTGTTSLSSALAGFVDDRYAFAVIMNRSPVNATVARAAQDRFVTVLARAA